MSVEEFFALFLEELRCTPQLTSYYKLLANPRSFEFRKAYVVQRLRYILAHLPAGREVSIWDCGCGYGTTAIFLALNGYRVHGTTLAIEGQEDGRGAVATAIFLALNG